MKQNKYLQTAQMELDLHGLTKEEAREEVLDLLSEANLKGYNKIRIITGKGIHSEDNRGVLKEYVQFMLDEKGLKYTDAKINEGGSGAINIEL
ncbi:MAG: Smr/MutS family protein [Candidatus Pacebacteria bacterium]|nr:Smr/MutS family protein [Candidatus Paceibacterota bacterium]